MNTLIDTSIDAFRSQLLKGAMFSEPNEFPLLKKSICKPSAAIPFEKAIKSAVTDQWIHFYMHDRKFERVWNRPNAYLPLFKRFAGVISPDYSVCFDMPLIMQEWNTFRNRVLAYWLQSMDIPVIPNISWGDERSYAFAFEGIEKGGTVAVGTVGTMKDRVNRTIFSDGLKVMADVLRPETVVCVGSSPESVFGFLAEKGIELIRIESHTAAVFKARGGRNG